MQHRQQPRCASGEEDIPCRMCADRAISSGAPNNKG
eukprot:CAMPEP_0183373262 /NCGR_PEP_ID=MMETSP0164_2-20130417/110921_1 /TAXON_ID=221442 /ORGANISM="Coccolithus pelagicus ssp braarudi, Strain PLY182g" /LENGTH=35 /DNA_ID= /DNA_START= /DNA_END= /DNA_ORIENTATION=